MERKESERRFLRLVTNADGETVAALTQNLFRDPLSSLEKAREMIEHPEGIVRITTQGGDILTINEQYLKGVQKFDRERKGWHVIFIARYLREARTVTFQPNPYRTPAIMSSGS